MLENENATHPCAQSSHPGTNRQGCDLTDSKERGKLSGPGFSLHFWLVKKFESRYPMKWMDFFISQLPMKNFWAIGKRRKCKDFVTETPSLTIAPHHWSQLHLQEPPAVYQNWYSFHLYFWLSLSFAWCCYHWLSLFSCTSHLENMYLLPP